MQFKPFEALRNFFSRIHALCQEFLTKCHIKKEDPNLCILLRFATDSTIKSDIPPAEEPGRKHDGGRKLWMK